MAKQKFDFQSTLLPPSTPPTISGMTGNIISPLQAERPKSLLDAYKIIPRHKIRFNKKNKYPLSEIEKLENYILHYGILQDILVIYSIEEDMYIIEAGHRRTTALDNLINKYQDWQGDVEDKNYKLYLQNVKCYESGYVCKVIDKLKEDIEYDSADESLDESAIDSEIRLIITNEGSRDIDPVVRAANIQRLAQLYELKNRGKKRTEKININQTIADEMNITPRQVINYKSLDKLIPELIELFEQKKISLKTAVAYSSLDTDAQEEIINMINSGTPVKSQEIKLMMEERQSLLKKLQDKQEKIEALTKATSLHSEKSGSPQPEKEGIAALREVISYLYNNIGSSIQELNHNMNILLSQDPESTNWIENKREQLRNML